MADTAQLPASSAKKYYDEAQQRIDEQAILDRYNAATIAQFNIQREQNRMAENQFYNQMYNTQKTAMDTIRQANAAAVSSGASRGVQAANELSALLGLQSESVASATELAQANRQTAQEETVKVLENVLQAYQQATQERQQYVQSAIESASVDVQREANTIAAMDITQKQRDALQSALKEGLDFYLAELSAQKDLSTYSDANAQYLSTALSTLSSIESSDFESGWSQFWGGTHTKAQAKAQQLETQITKILDAFNLKEPDQPIPEKYKTYLDKISNITKITDNSHFDDYIKAYGEDEPYYKKGEGISPLVNNRINILQRHRQTLIATMLTDYMHKTKTTQTK